MNNFIPGVMLGALLVFIWAWRNAERIVKTKQEMKENDRRRGTPLIALLKNRTRKFTTPQEAVLVPESDIVFQYPRRGELEAVPGNKNDELYDTCFGEYIINRKLTNPEAWKEFQKDYHHLLPEKDKPGRKLELTNLRKAFYSAMRRRREALTRKT